MPDGFFGSSTPSSKKPFKKTIEKKEGKPKGARPGHEGHGRKGHENGTVDCHGGHIFLSPKHVLNAATYC